MVAGAAAGTAVALAQQSNAAAGEALVLPGTGARTLNEERRALFAARRQADQARARSVQLQARAQRASKTADKAKAEAAALAARIQESEADIQAAQARVAIVTRLQRAQARRLAQRQQPIVRLTAALQMIARRPAALALVQPGSIADAVHMRAVLDSVMPVIAERTAGLRSELARSRQLRAAAEQAAVSLRSSRAQLAERRTALGRLEAANRIASRNYGAGAGVEADRAIALGEQARDIVDLMDQMAVASEIRSELASLSGPVQRPQVPSAASGPARDSAPSIEGRPPAYRLPVIGALVTGMGEMADSGVRARGLTIATQPGAQVVAPTAGHVAYAGPYRGYGQIVIIDHGAGWTTLITGLARLSADVGASLAQGDPIGAAGLKVPTITVELRKNGEPVDIVPLLASG
jgi:septal ring factor EnvC (AmiA/AmiB activator)